MPRIWDSEESSDDEEYQNDNQSFEYDNQREDQSFNDERDEYYDDERDENYDDEQDGSYDDDRDESHDELNTNHLSNFENSNLNNTSMLSMLLSNAIRKDNLQDMKYLAEKNEQYANLESQQAKLLNDAVKYLSRNMYMPNITNQVYANSYEKFQNTRLYSDQHFLPFKQSAITEENYNNVVSITQMPFIKGHIFHNFFQILIRIKNIYLEKLKKEDPEDPVHALIENDDLQPSLMRQRRESIHPNKKSNCTRLYIDDPSIDMNDVIAEDVSLIENLRRFLYFPTSNYAYFVMENEDPTNFENLPEANEKNQKVVPDLQS